MFCCKKSKTVELEKAPPKAEEPRKSIVSLFTTSEDEETVVVNLSDIPDGQMKECSLDDGEKFLLVRSGNDVTALSPRCTHYNAPLINGVLADGRIRCPLHGACFNARTGDIEDFPGLDGLYRFPVVVTNKQVKVKVSKTALAKNNRVAKMSKKDKNNSSAYVIVGAGGAGLAAAECLRRVNYSGRVILISMEKNLPYDRPKLSKSLDLTPDKLQLRPLSFFIEHDIELLLEKEVTNVDIQSKKVSLNSGDSITYSKLLLASGSRPRTLKMTGIECSNVKVLRTIEDANLISELGCGKNVVVIGSSFIGMEVSSYLANSGAKVTVISLEKVPYELALGEEVGIGLMKWFESKGVVFRMSSTTKDFITHDDKVTEVELESGEVVPTDLVVLGIGVASNTEFLQGSSIELDNRGNVMVNEFMETNIPDVYAAGDIANFPLHLFGESERAVIGHWQLALKHGEVAARSMAGKKEALKTVPFFWSVLFGKSLRYAGYGMAYDGIYIDGSLEDLTFVAYYFKENIVVAVATLNRDPVASAFANRLYAGSNLTKEQILEDSNSWMK